MPIITDMESLLESVVRRLNSAPLGTARRIAETKQLGYDTVLRIKRGDIDNPRIQTLEAIRQGLDEYWPDRQVA